MKAIMFSKDDWKHLRSENYNWSFNKKDGTFLRWGKTQEDDPTFSHLGPEIADIEILSGACSGSGAGGKDSPCRFCYKSNGGNEVKYMSLENFKKIFSLLTQNKNLGQIAFGITDVDKHPQMWDIFQHCRDNEVAPNLTINGNKLTPEILDNLAKYCGAIAVSHYDDDKCFGAVQELTSRGMNQINIHKMLSLESYQSCLDLIDKAKNDPRLKNLNAIVFLALKPKGRGKNFTPLLSVQKYKTLIQKAMDNGIGIGFDSCSAPMFLKSMEQHEKYDQFQQLAEPCESQLFSIYLDVDGNVWPCSFCEDVSKTLVGGVEIKPINALEAEDFLKDIWYAPQTVAWRKNLINSACNGCRQCPVYDINNYCEEECCASL